MIRNTYILYIDDPRSIAYMKECVESCAQFPAINPIPVQGYHAVPVQALCDEFHIHTIPYYTKQLPQNAAVLNRTFSCNAGHYKIWQMIADSGESGVVLEHDAIVKHDYASAMYPEVRDGEIMWLGPRVNNVTDYTYPEHIEPALEEVVHWEGAHAYAITANTAKYLLDCVRRDGINDAIDGQLGMRNIFDLHQVAADPPSVVAMVGNRASTIEKTGVPAVWNAQYTKGFLAGISKDCKLPPIRHPQYTNRDFYRHANLIHTALEDTGKLRGDPQCVLVLGAYEGLSSVWLSNRLLTHEDSEMHIISQFRGTTEHKQGKWPAHSSEKICKFNTYFSKYYHRINTISVEKDSDLLQQASADQDIKFDVIYVDQNHEFKEVLHDAILCWTLLNDDGILIFDDAELDSVAKAIDVLTQVTNAHIIHNQHITILHKRL
jgi:hypothetical protein